MLKSKRLLVPALGLALSLVLTGSMSMSVEAGDNGSYPELLNGGVASLLNMQDETAEELMEATEKELRQMESVEDLDEAIAQGCTEIWELAERFGVTEQFMRKAVCYYVHGNLATELYF